MQLGVGKGPLQDRAVNLPSYRTPTAPSRFRVVDDDCAIPALHAGRELFLKLFVIGVLAHCSCGAIEDQTNQPGLKPLEEHLWTPRLA